MTVSEATPPSITQIKIGSQFQGESKLDKLATNYKDWEDEISIVLSLNGLYGYVTGTTPAPEASQEPRAYNNWKHNDDLANALITSSITKSEKDFFDRSKPSKKNWETLKERHQNEGPVKQVTLLQQALNTQCSKEEPLPLTARKICDLIQRAFEIGTITPDLLCSIALLNSLSSHYPHARSIISRDISLSSKERPYTSKDIRLFLENEQTILDANKTRDTPEPFTLATRTSKTFTPTTCSNCKRSGHSNAYCISEGGGMAGKTIEDSKQARKRDREARKEKGKQTTNTTTSNAKVSVTMKDANGRAFIMLVDPSNLSSPKQEFAGLASDPTEAENTESVEYEGWLVIDDEPYANIDWGTNDQHPGEDALAIETYPISNSCSDSHKQPFYLDTGATVHISPDRNDFITLRPIVSRSVRGVGGSSIFAVAIGDIKLNVTQGDPIILRNALYIPKATVRLISVIVLAQDSGVVAHFDDKSCWITNKVTKNIVAQGTVLPNKNLYTLYLHSSPVTTERAYTAGHTPNIETWHRRLGHANYQALGDMVRKGMVTGLSTLSPSNAPKCESCILGKQTKTPVPKKREVGPGHRATRKLEKVWVDLSGPHAVTSRTGNSYVMDILDDYTSMPWTIPLKLKDDSFDELKAWEMAREAETGLKVGTYITDRGELRSAEMREWLKSRGTDHLFTAPYTSSHIGRVERMHRTLMAKARTMRLYANLPAYLWDELYLTATHLQAKTTTRSLQDVTPWERWHERKPDYSYMREIGCKAFVLIQNKHNPKIFERSIECVLIGYDAKSKAYRCYHRETKKVHSSYHVRSLESHDGHLPELTPQETITTSAVAEPTSLQDIQRRASSMPLPINDEDSEEEYFPPNNLTQTVGDEQKPPNLPPAPQEPRRSNRTTTPTEKLAPDSRRVTRTERAIQESKESADRIREARSTRKKTLENLQTQTGSNDPKIADATAIEELREAFGTLNLGDIGENPNQASEILAALSDFPDLNPATMDFQDEPRTWDEAVNSTDSEKWRKGYREELDSLKEMGVYKLIPRSEVPQGHKVRKGRPVFKIKRDETGKAVRWKVRLVFKGFEQIYGKDYNKTTSPTARMESWRVLLHLAAALGYDAQQIDVKTAFLYGLLPEDEIQYMEQPRGFEEKGMEDHVWLIQRGLYGMKQSGRIWNQTLNKQMLSWGFTRLTCESCIYYRKSNTGTVIAAVHVDDFLSIASTKDENDRFKEQMKKTWTISELGEARFVVGIAITWNREQRTVMLSQTALIDKIILQFGQKDASPLSVPMDPGLKLRRVDRTTQSQEDQSQLTKLPYRSLVGCLLYLAISTRPDISYAVQQLSQYLDSYSFIHWNAAIRLVRYLKGTRELKLHLGGTNPVELLGFTDSDWANCLDTRRSVGGYAWSLGSGILSWNARKQKTVAASSCEAEYVAAFEAAREGITV